MPPKRGRGRGRGLPSRQEQPQERPGDSQRQEPEARGPPPGFQGQRGGPGREEPQQESRDPPPGFQGQRGGPRREEPQYESPPVSRQQQGSSAETAVQALGFEFTYKAALTTPLPKSPGEGKLGRPIQLISNCYPLQIPSGNVYHYDVEILSKRQSTTTVSADAAKQDKKYRCMSTRRNRDVIQEMMRCNDHFQNLFTAYDGRKNMFARKPLNFVRSEFKCEVVMRDGVDPKDPGGPKPDVFQVVIKPVRKKETNDCAISLDPLHALFAGKSVIIPQEVIMAIETVLRHGPCRRYFPVGRSFFYPPSPKDVHPLGGGKEIWFGYHQSLRLGQWKPMVNLDTTATTFYQSGPVLNYIADILRLRRDELATVNLRDSDIQRLSRELKNMRIETNHMKKSYKRKYRILRFTRENANRLTFTLNEKKVTVAQYFKQVYNRTLEHANLPCIQANPEAKKVYLPIEVCDMIEGQHCKKKLEDRQSADMVKVTARAPKIRFSEIENIRKMANFSRDAYLKEFGIEVSAKPLAVGGRVLEAPNVLYTVADNPHKVKPKDGSWDMRAVQYYRPAEIGNWVLISFANQRYCGDKQLENFARLLCNIAQEQGIRVNRPAKIHVVDRRREKTESVLRSMQNDYKASLAVVVVPGNDKSVYGEVKQAAETCLGLVTQCIKDDSVVKKCNPPLVSNLCQKINAKMGGVNNALVSGEKPPIMRKPVIFIGADVTHPSPSGDIKPSLAAAVGSLDAHPSRYAVTIRAQTNIDEKKQSIEIILELKSMILDLLKAFYRNTNGKKPEKIVFYRDGVSEGQFDKVREHEVQCIREACRTLDSDYQPGITFIVVQKRHHTRFMPQDDRSGCGKMRNIPPGTTVDTVVTHPLNFDFFLCSHYGLQGTSRPCHYTVIEDDNDFTADDLQKLTYYLCHTYVRCTKSISSPAPVMYAHLAAYRARQHLMSLGDESSAASTSSTFEYQPLPAEVMNAIKVKDNLYNTMYFV